MTAATNFELKTDFLRTDYGGGNMGFFQWSDDDDRFRRRRGVEPSVTNVRLQNGCVRRVGVGEENGGNILGRINGLA